MHVGKLLLSGANVMSPWMEREGDNAYFQYEIIQVSNSATITVEVWHKNAEETGEGELATDTFSQIGSTGVYAGDFTALKELVRFEFTVSTTAAAASGTVDTLGGGTEPLMNGAVAWILFRMLEPTYYDKA